MVENLKPVKGYFKIQAEDVDGNVIYEYEDNNKIMANVPYFYSLINSGNLSGFNIEDFKLTSFAMGCDGVDEEGVIKEFSRNQTKLYSELNFWGDALGSEELDRKAYVYQVTWEHLPNQPGGDFITLLNEGTTVPYSKDPNGDPLPNNYRGPVLVEDGYGLDIKYRYEKNILTFNILLNRHSGNGLSGWNNPPAYSEAALYMKKDATTKGDQLGTIFSMKTFPELPKTDICVIKITWSLNYSYDDFF